MVIYLVASEVASRFERWGDVSLCMRRASTVLPSPPLSPPPPIQYRDATVAARADANEPYGCVRLGVFCVVRGVGRAGPSRRIPRNPTESQAALATTHRRVWRRDSRRPKRRAAGLALRLHRLGCAHHAPVGQHGLLSHRHSDTQTGDRVRQREAREWALASEQPLSLETQVRAHRPVSSGRITLWRRMYHPHSGTH